MAVLSCLNSGIYVASRVLFTLAAKKDAPMWIVQVDRRGVPSRAILVGAAIACAAVALEALLVVRSVAQWVPSAVLFYGTDAGLVSERAGLLARRLAEREGSEVLRLDDADLENEPARISIELQTVAMFGGRKVVHAVGIVAGAVAGGALFTAAVRYGGVPIATGVALFALCVLLMLACSAIYNLTRPSRARRVLRRIDEAAIFLMIAGSYTPFIIKLLPEFEKATGIKVNYEIVPY